MVVAGERRQIRDVENCRTGDRTSHFINRVCQRRLNSGADCEIKCAGKIEEVAAAIGRSCAGRGFKAASRRRRAPVHARPTCGSLLSADASCRFEPAEEAMKAHSGARKAARTRRRKAAKPKRRDAPEGASPSTPSQEEIARLTRELNEALEQRECARPPASQAWRRASNPRRADAQGRQTDWRFLHLPPGGAATQSAHRAPVDTARCANPAPRLVACVSCHRARCRDMIFFATRREFPVMFGSAPRVRKPRAP